jgi:hypothetical protein
MPHRRAQSNRTGPAVLAAALAVMLAPAPVSAEEIYRYVDEQGVTSFSDVPLPDAERVQLNAPPPSVGGAAAARAMIELQLAVAKALEESRLAREKAQAELLEARAASRPRTVVYYPLERTVYGGGYLGGYWWPGYGHRPDRPDHRPDHPDHRPDHPDYRPDWPDHRPPQFRPVHPVVPRRPPTPTRTDHQRGSQPRAFGTGGSDRNPF